MKTSIKVVGAAIVKDGKILALRRSDGNDEVVHKFEFVGGKVEEGETFEQALIRECMEELSLKVEVGDLLNTIEYDYPNTSVSLSVYFVKPLSDYKLIVHEEERWMDCSKIDPDEWAPADKQFLSSLKKGYSKTVNAEQAGDFDEIRAIAENVMKNSYSANAEEGLLDYVLSNTLGNERIESNIKERNYTYKLIKFNGETAGFYSYCPAEKSGLEISGGTYLSQFYIKEFARGKKMANKVIASLQRPVYLTVRKDDNKSVAIFKHLGFKIVQNIKRDIGSGYILDDFLMILK